jgi:ribokinase
MKKPEVSLMDAIGFGALNLDRICFVDKIPKAEEESFLLNLKEYPGGSAANTIVGLSRLNAKTGYLGKIAEDHAGKVILEDLRKEDVDTYSVKIAEGRSGTAEVFVDKEGMRSIIVDPGVNDYITMEDVDLNYIERFKILHLTSFVCKTSKNSFETQKKLLREIFNPKISFDPGFLYAEKGLEEMKDILKNTDILLLNEKESKILTKEKDFDDACNILADYVDILVVKRGKKGCFVKEDEKEFFSKPFETRVRDTTGAGDAFNAGFLFGVLRKKDIEESAKIGNRVASLSIEKSGAREGLPHI